MKPKNRITVWVILLLFGMTSVCFSEQFIITDAAGGIFPEDQSLCFSITGPGWLKLLLDSREIYRGRGPAYPEIGVSGGEERGFSLRAEYYSPLDELLESRSWYIYIDKKVPAIPEMELRDTVEGIRLFKSGGERNAMVRAWADIAGDLVFFPDLGGEGLLPADSFPALVWAEDLAGNFSEPRYEYFEISPVKIENPVPGKWLNPQVLVISGTEGKNVYWTIDGSHPLESAGTGRLYLGPERIEERGEISLRIAWRDSSGRIREDRTEYSVAESEAGFPSELDIFRLTEDRELESVTVLNVPPMYLWSMGGLPRNGGGESVSLRPETLIKRTAALHLSNISPGEGIYRFIYILDGSVNGENPSFPVMNPARISQEEYYLYPGMADLPPLDSESAYEVFQRNAAGPLRLFTAGRCRLIIWPDLPGIVYYSWGENAMKTGESWPQRKGPLPVPVEGGELHWFVIGREGADSRSGESFIAGPFKTNIPSLYGVRRGNVRGRIAYRNYSENESAPWVYASVPLDYAPGILSSRNSGSAEAAETGGAVPDVCDGEDLEWAFVSSGGMILEQQRRDRLAPSAPGLSGIPEGGWTRKPVKVSTVSGERDVTGIITARLRYASGSVEILSGTGSLEITSSLGELAEVTIESLLLDASGNRSPKTIRHFSLDPNNLYVSSVPLLPGVYGTANIPSPMGGMDNPFPTLEEALDFALMNGFGDIRVAGIQELNRPISVYGNMRINGLWMQNDGSENTDARAVLVLGDGFSWNIASGAALTLSSLRMERKGGDKPLIQAGINGKLEIAGLTLTNTGPLLSMDKGFLLIRDSLMSINVPGERRTAAFTIRESEVELYSNRMQLEADYGLLFSLEGGSLSAEENVFLAAGLRTAALFDLNGTRCNFLNLTLQAAARDYASIMEASGSEIAIGGGVMEVSARNVTSLLFNNSAGLVSGARIRVEGAFSARAAEIRGTFPLFRNSFVFSTGTASKSAVFSGTEAASPLPFGITGNRFSGFAYIWGEGWPMEKLNNFNKVYASPEEPNILLLPPQAGRP